MHWVPEQGPPSRDHTQCRLRAAGAPSGQACALGTALSTCVLCPPCAEAGPGPWHTLNPQDSPGKGGRGPERLSRLPEVTEPARGGPAPQRPASGTRPAPTDISTADKAQLLLVTQQSNAVPLPPASRTELLVQSKLLPLPRRPYRPGRSVGALEEGREAHLAIDEDKVGSQFWAPPQGDRSGQLI